MCRDIGERRDRMRRRIGRDGMVAAQDRIETGGIARNLALILAFVLALVGLVLATREAGAALVHWNNGAGGTWSTAANWSPAVVPNQFDDVLIDAVGTYTVTATGAINVKSIAMGTTSGVQTLLGNGTITVSAGVRAVAGTHTGVLASATIAGSPSVYIPPASTLTLRTIVASLPINNEGMLILEGYGSVNGGYTGAAGTMLRLMGAGGAGSSIQTFANGFTNNGTIELNSSGGAYAAIVYVTAGTLVNAPGRTIDVQAGAGGTRTLGLQLDNQGTLAVGAAVNLEKTGSAHLNSGTINVSGGNLAINPWSGSLTNTGTITIGSGRTLTISGGSLQHNSGSISGSGSMVLNGSVTASFANSPAVSALSISNATATFSAGLNTGVTALDVSSSTVNGPGMITIASGDTLTLQTTIMNAPLVNNGTLQLTGSGSVNGGYTSGVGSSLRLPGTAGV